MKISKVTIISIVLSIILASLSTLITKAYILIEGMEGYTTMGFPFAMFTDHWTDVDVLNSLDIHYLGILGNLAIYFVLVFVLLSLINKYGAKKS
ncbi:hypothetical protein HN358_01250 [Candidatus Uhrbacteria bacterium]|jgi:hypothetical protein|nr:hypothetical protein [Candidatus Uhrbacteria bacterium]MBT7717342.1 hypothetical protein [Candidatus Uhrbacteria bacterium]